MLTAIKFAVNAASIGVVIGLTWQQDPFTVSWRVWAAYLAASVLAAVYIAVHEIEKKYHGRG